MVAKPARGAGLLLGVSMQPVTELASPIVTDAPSNRPPDWRAVLSPHTVMEVRLITCGIVTLNVAAGLCIKRVQQISFGGGGQLELPTC
mmetsp:Transcript_560/g.1198  ORF Transcript_560/g.1198 Transcript_560/m.1198 type:complete len:89 (+) Transcript_560:187-453(+)